MRVAASIRVTDATQAVRDARAAAAAGAEWIELRLDPAPAAVAAGVVAAVRAAQPRPVIAACPRRDEGGDFAGRAAARGEILAAAVRGGAAWLDLPHPGIEAGGAVHPAGIPAGTWRAVRSWHEPRGERHDLERVQDALEASLRPGDVAKLVAWADAEADSWRCLPLYRRARAPLIAFAQGPGGRASRLWAPALGAPWTYACLDERPTAPGQWSLAELAARWRPDGPVPGEPLYAVVGRPVAHSLSPRLWSAALRAAGLPGVYGAIEPPADGFGAFVAAHRDPAFRGFSVTAPFKRDALAAAREADSISIAAGAANTLERLAGGGWRAWNTDGDAALDALAAAGAPRGAALLVIGAGGAAAAAAAVAARRGHAVTLAARRPAAARELAVRLGVASAPLERVRVADFPLVIQATPLGGLAQPGCVLTANPFRAGSTVLDMVYRPAATGFLRQAEADGAIPVRGSEMLVRQMLGQFRILTGRDADMSLSRSVAEAAIADDSTSAGVPAEEEK